MNEDDLLAIVAEYFPKKGKNVLLNRGDDCAVLAGAGNLAVSTDVFCENSHFRRAYFSPQDLGHKCLAVNLSDLAAAGAEPEAFTLGLTLTGKENEHWLRGFCAGMAALAERHDIALIGGDLAKGGQLNMCPTVWGRVQNLGLRRGEAQAGDLLFCVGKLGLARGGLLLLEEELKKPQPDFESVKKSFPHATGQHLRPEPLCREGKIIAALAGKDRFSLMDVSDGLARDLPRLLGNNEGGTQRLGAELNLLPENLHPEVICIAQLQQQEPVLFAFAGGEDYALLGTCPPEAWENLLAALPDCLPLGRVTETRELLLNGKVASVQGFDHFGQAAEGV